MPRDGEHCVEEIQSDVALVGIAASAKGEWKMCGGESNQARQAAEKTMAYERAKLNPSTMGIGGRPLGSRPYQYDLRSRIVRNIESAREQIAANEQALALLDKNPEIEQILLLDKTLP